MQAEVRFEIFVREILEENNYHIAVLGSYSKENYDFLIYNAAGLYRIVEAKLLRGKASTLALLRTLCARVASFSPPPPCQQNLLVVGMYIHPDHKRWSEREFSIEIWDRADLTAKAQLSGDPYLLDSLKAIFEDEHNETQPVNITDDTGNSIALEIDAHKYTRTIRNLGLDLIERLDNVQPGRNESKSYEILCKDIIDFVFGRDLVDPRVQTYTVDRVSFYDIIYRPQPHHPFWTTLTRDFRSRIIVFECKNYSAPIRGNQIFLTERYLGSSMLRTICFILTRKKPHRSAILAAQGAMRDSGKLLVILHDDILTELIKSKIVQEQNGTPSDELYEKNDPAHILDQVIFDFLATASR